MDRNTVERVTDWDSEPFTGGYGGLREFADREFSGAVTDGGAWLFMLNGRVLGVFDGDIDQFEDADGTAHVAPDRSLPLLFAMQETGGEVRGEYYTEETPLSEVDRTLQSGNFTGYVELSENVLSGDYYLAYYGGRRLPVAFVGNQERRLTGDEAFDRAAGEVGIYRVKTVDLEITDVPEPQPEPTPAAAGAETDPTDGEASASEPETGDTATAPEAESDDPPAVATDETTGWSTEADSGNDPTDTDTAHAESGGADGRSTDTTDTDSTTAATPETDEPRGDEQASEPAADRAASASTVAENAASTDGAETDDTSDSTKAEADAEPSEPSHADTESDSRFAAESEWQGTTTIPALDPAESVSMERTGSDGAEDASSTAAETEMAAEAPTDAEDAASIAAASDGITDEEAAELRSERDRLRERVEELEAETERLSDERDRLESERDEAAATVEELEAEVEQLEATVAELEAELEAVEEYVPDEGEEISPERAIEGTSLFVRYERQGGPTLSDAHDGAVDREAVNDNVRLEHHTEFDDEGALVDGEPFDEWLRGRIEYGFVEWLTRAFVHDVRETRNQTAMGKLFDAVPEIDRIEFQGSVDLGAEADAESASFDVVLRDRMGQPLIVADLNDAREPATEPMLETLIRNATPVGEANEQLSAAFFVTTSYYEPDALGTAEEATGGGFLSRDRHKSFVKLSRKDGYHLCLVETRDGEFHVSVPEL